MHKRRRCKCFENDAGVLIKSLKILKSPKYFEYFLTIKWGKIDCEQFLAIKFSFYKVGCDFKKGRVVMNSWLKDHSSLLYLTQKIMRSLFWQFLLFTQMIVWDQVKSNVNSNVDSKNLSWKFHIKHFAKNRISCRLIFLFKHLPKTWC